MEEKNNEIKSYKKVKCFKCGTVYELDIKHISNLVSCPHCHKKMELDKKLQE